MESRKNGILRGREVFSCSSPSVANPTVNHSSLFKTSYCVKADFASFHLLIKRQQGGEKEITHIKCRWAEKIRLAKNLVSSPTDVLRCAPFHTACKLLRAVHFCFHRSFTLLAQGCLSLVLKEKVQRCLSNSAWLSMQHGYKLITSVFTSKTTISFSFKY